jgi:DNA integrity scanning protein DisA with diadenylate cyclase activity
MVIDKEFLDMVSMEEESIHMLCMQGDIEGILNSSESRGSRKEVIKRAIEILIGLSLKGYEGRSVGAIFLIGDLERVKRNSSQMIINPFKGWKDVNIKDLGQLATIESFSQLDGAMVFDNRGFAQYAGRMIKVFENECDEKDWDFEKRKGKGSGTRWRAARFITLKSRTVALTLSSNGNITAFKDGKEIGRLERRLCSMDLRDIPIYLHPKMESIEN